ncbi:hypothetical protein MKZ07_05995 [Paenibacillus sp. FSL P4-0338]|uniref:hypothetical protein n=1 Tax=unclassified Paenibacillus TaxID=185978 RepID=UPI0012EC5DC3|nr:hypothetical protein [Paenibacillus sp. FSL R7-269]
MNIDPKDVSIDLQGRVVVDNKELAKKLMERKNEFQLESNNLGYVCGVNIGC